MVASQDGIAAENKINFHIPIKLVGNEQTLPVVTALVGHCSPDTLLIDPPCIDLGNTAINSGASFVDLTYGLLCSIEYLYHS